MSLKFMRCLLIMIGVVCLTSCGKRTLTTVDASTHPEITAKFTKFGTDEFGERAAEFELNNKSKFAVAGFRATIIGSNEDGEEIYSIPWSHVGMPQIVGANSKTTLEDVGFEIPDLVVELKLVFGEFDLAE